MAAPDRAWSNPWPGVFVREEHLMCVCALPGRQPSERWFLQRYPSASRQNRWQCVHTTMFPSFGGVLVARWCSPRVRDL